MEVSILGKVLVENSNSSQALYRFAEGVLVNPKTSSTYLNTTVLFPLNLDRIRFEHKLDIHMVFLIISIF